MKQHKPLTRKTPLASKSTLKRSGFKATAKPLKSVQGFKGQGFSSFKQKTYEELIEQERKKPKAKNYGLKGKGRSDDDIKLHSAIVATGCFGCQAQGKQTLFPLRIHHLLGRNKGKASDVSEKVVLCLCDQCHDPEAALIPSDQKRFHNLTAASVHGNKKLFREVVGDPSWCVLETYKIIGRQPEWLSPNQWYEYFQLQSKTEQESFAIQTLSYRSVG